MIISKCNSNLRELKRIFRIGRNPDPQQGRNEWRHEEGNWAAPPVIEAGGMGGQDRPTCCDIQPTTLPSMPPAPGVSSVICPLHEVILQKSCRGRSCWSQERGHSMGFPVGFLCLPGPKRSGPESPHWPWKSLSWGHHIQYQKGLSGLMAGSKPAATSIKTQAPHTETVLPFSVNSDADQVSFSMHQGQHLTCKYQQGNFSSRIEK